MIDMWIKARNWTINLNKCQYFISNCENNKCTIEFLTNTKTYCLQLKTVEDTKTVYDIIINAIQHERKICDISEFEFGE